MSAKVGVHDFLDPTIFILHNAGILIALFLNMAEGAWDNAKKTTWFRLIPNPCAAQRRHPEALFLNTAGGVWDNRRRLHVFC